VRIVAGKHRGRRLTAPGGRQVRPTSDRVRESLFSILTEGSATLSADTRVLDAFAGSGALGLESLSRGAGFATFMDTDRECNDLIDQTLADFDEHDRAKVLRRDATRPGKPDIPCDLVFLDPPYRQGLVPKALDALRQGGWIAPGTQIVIELSKKESIAVPEGYDLETERTYGNTRILILDAKP
jgi:16S rRNA (guanine966-N2)-methyltransferase